GIAPGETQRAIAEDPLRVGEMAHELLDRPLRRGVAVGTPRLAEPAERRAELVELTLQQGHDVLPVLDLADVPCEPRRHFGRIGTNRDGHGAASRRERANCTARSVLFHSCTSELVP